MSIAFDPEIETAKNYASESIPIGAKDDYAQTTVSEVLADSQDGIGKKVSVSGWGAWNDKEVIFLSDRPDSNTSLMVDIRKAPKPLRLHIMQSCGNTSFRCRVTVKGTVIEARASGEGVYLLDEE